VIADDKKAAFSSTVQGGGKRRAATSSRQRPRFKAEAKNGAFYVSVRDTGPGISTADQAKLFQEFQQADNAITKKKGGTGLGLAISKRIIEMHGGRIWVESQPGQGSTFAFTLSVIVERQIGIA
jgi:signal transduction histidine kinase